MPDACITRNLAFLLLPPCISPGANWRQLPFTCFSIFTTWHSLPLATISDWGAVSWCNWQSLCSPEKEWVEQGKGQGRAQPVLAHSYPAGRTFPEDDKACSSSPAMSTFLSEAFWEKDSCVTFASYPSLLWLFPSLASLACLAMLHSQWTPTRLLSRLYQLECI